MSFRQNASFIPQEIKEKLPKASWIHVEWVKPIFLKRKFYSRHRLANAVRIRVGNLCITLRAPWLPDVAKTLHPHLFKAEPPSRVYWKIKG